MAILSGKEIDTQRQLGNIVILPWDESRVNPNSYNLALGSTLLVYRQSPWWKKLWLWCRGTPWCLDMRCNNPVDEIIIPPGGIRLRAGMLYLASTVEYTETNGLVPRLDGRSSCGRLGLCVHITAAFGDIGYRGKWTLEMTVIHPLRVYAGSPVCQISYNEVSGEYDSYKGKYQDAAGVMSSRMHQDKPTPYQS